MQKVIIAVFLLACAATVVLGGTTGTTYQPTTQMTTEYKTTSAAISVYQPMALLALLPALLYSLL